MYAICVGGGYIKMSVYDFGIRLKELREDLNITQQTVADRLGVTVGTIKRYESNTQLPPVDKLEKIALMYRTSLDYLRNLNHRKPIYIDDLPESKQKMIIDIIENVRAEYRK